jgi:hypothetical protein
MHSLRRAACVIFLVGLVPLAAAADEIATTPYRPTVSNPAALPRPGWLEVEAGALRASGGELSRRDSIPYLAKLAFTPDWGLLVGGEAHVAQRDFDSNRLSGAGDTQLVLKRRFAVDEDAAFGIEAGVKFPTAKSGIGSDKHDYAVNGIYSAAFGRYGFDVNVSLTRVGAIEDDASRIQVGWAAALSRALDERWTLAAELSGTARRGVSGTAQFLLATGYSVSRHITLDAGVAMGLNRATPDWQVFAGITALVGQLW